MSTDMSRDPETLTQHVDRIGEQRTQTDLLNDEKLYMRLGHWLGDAARDGLDREIGS